MELLVLLIGFVVGLFASSQIIYPILYSLPKLRQYAKQGLLIKPVPLWYTIITPVIWLILFAISILIFSNYFSSLTNYYLMGFGVSAVVIIVQIPRKNKDLEIDFKHSYRKFLKEQVGKEFAAKGKVG